MRKIIYLIIIILGPAGAVAQTLSDGVIMARNDFCTGFIYLHDQWKKYWEGTLKRENANMGTVTTQSVTWMGFYGLTPKIGLIATLPYVWTHPSHPMLSGMKGMQDLTIGAKYNFFKDTLGAGVLSTYAAGSFSTPVTAYSPDFLPFSIGLACKRLAGRVIANYKLNNGLFFTGSYAFTWRSNVFLDRPSYYTDGELYLTNEVWMPHVVDYSLSVGYMRNSLNAVISYSQQTTLGGDDIHRQDLPFVSNRMNFSKADATVMYFLPVPKGLAVKAAAGYTLAGRNVGQSTYVMGGLLYTIHFSKNAN